MNVKPLAALFAVLRLVLAPMTAHAQGAVVPGRSLGRVVLGMSRAAVWKALGRPTKRRGVSGLPAPHPPGAYTLDTWEGSAAQGARYLYVLCHKGRAVQVEDSGPQTSLGRNVPWAGTFAGTFSDIRRRYPRLRVDAYDFSDYDNGNTRFYADDVRAGIAFKTAPVSDGADAYNALPTERPDSLIVHVPGARVLPVTDDAQMIVTAQPPVRDSLARYLPQMRAWFAGSPHHPLREGE